MIKKNILSHSLELNSPNFFQIQSTTPSVFLSSTISPSASHTTHPYTTTSSSSKIESSKSHKTKSSNSNNTSVSGVIPSLNTNTLAAIITEHNNKSNVTNTNIDLPSTPQFFSGSKPRISRPIKLTKRKSEPNRKNYPHRPLTFYKKPFYQQLSLEEEERLYYLNHPTLTNPTILDNNIPNNDAADSSKLEVEKNNNAPTNPSSLDLEGDKAIKVASTPLLPIKKKRGRKSKKQLLQMQQELQAQQAQQAIISQPVKESLPLSQKKEETTERELISDQVGEEVDEVEGFLLFSDDKDSWAHRKDRTITFNDKEDNDTAHVGQTDNTIFNSRRITFVQKVARALEGLGGRGTTSGITEWMLAKWPDLYGGDKKTLAHRVASTLALKKNARLFGKEQPNPPLVGKTGFIWILHPEIVTIYHSSEEEKSHSSSENVFAPEDHSQTEEEQIEEYQDESKKPVNLLFFFSFFK